MNYSVSGAQDGDKVKVFADIEGRCLQGLATIYTGKKRFVGYGEVKMARIELFGTKEPPK